MCYTRRSSLLFVLLVSSAGCAHALQAADAKDSLVAELAAISTGNARNKNLQGFQDELQWVYSSLPKNGAGKLDFATMRYALHRFFLYRNGWYVNGFGASRTEHEAEDATHGSTLYTDTLQDVLREWVRDDGVGLQEIAALATSFQSLIRRETREVLAKVYQAYDFSRNGHLRQSDAEAVLKSYYVGYLSMAAYSPKNRTDAEQYNTEFWKSWPNQDQSQAWIKDLVTRDLRHDPDGTVSFDAMAGLADEVGEQYYKLNDVECEDLTRTLSSRESAKGGRIRLSAFYAIEWYQHWHFNEKAKFLRDLGVLDESDPKSPYVIIPNYVQSLNNCFDGSALYASCCRNLCEDLMRHLETEVGQESGTVTQIAGLVARLPSLFVEAPRVLSGSLLAKLDEISQHHAGQVPLHGRLFAQWMHHAFPQECPYPHEAGSTKPQTASAWTKRHGEVVSLEEHEVSKYIEDDTCKLDNFGKPLCEESADFAWTSTEELFGTVVPKRSRSNQARFDIILVLVFACVFAFVWNKFLHRPDLNSKKVDDFDLTTWSGDPPRAAAKACVQWRPVSLLVGLTYLGFIGDLLDGQILALAMICSGLFLGMQYWSAFVRGASIIKDMDMEKCFKDSV